MKKRIIGMIGLVAVLSAEAETYRADVIQDACVYYTYEWPFSGRPGYSGTGSTVYIASYNGSTRKNFSSAYFKFDLSALPEGSAIESITMHVNGWGSPVAAHIYYVGDDSWSETNLDYYNQPSNQVNVADTSSWITTNGTWMARSINAAGWTNDWDGAVSLRLVSDGTQGTYTAREYGPATAAYLDISYTPPPPPVSLHVVSAAGSPSPSVGSNSFATGSVLDCFVADVTNGLSVYDCTGWTLLGNEPTSGSGNSFSLTLTNNAVLTWNWQTNYWLAAVASGGGQVGGGDAWIEQGSNVTLTATPDAGFIFMGWSGDASGTNDALVIMDAPKSVTATFSDDADGDGLTNTEEEAAGSNPWKSDTDDDGFDDAFEIAQGLSPTNDNSALVTYVAGREDIFELYPSNAVIDVAVGEVVLNQAGSNMVVSLQLEESENGINWTNAGPPEVWNWTVDGEKKFFRVRSAK